MTRTALHRVTPSRLAAARQQFAPALEGLPRPLVAVLVGGASRRHRFDPADGAALGRSLAVMAAESGAGLALTASRRTAPASLEALARELAGVPAQIWRGEGENPYFGYLALADAIVVTGDSVSMTSEACASGKPVYVAAMAGRGSKRIDRFFHALAEDRLIAPFAGPIGDWAPRPPLDETAHAAQIVRQRFEAWITPGSTPGTAP